MSKRLKAPFPWFGGKSRVAPLVWQRFGDVQNYVEPFFGAGAVLLGRPTSPGIETVNDIDGFVCNAWRSIAAAPEETARWADWPVNENDLHARNAWLIERRAALTQRLEGDPDYFDARIAGWWLWGVSCWIGSGFATASGPWNVVVDEGGGRRFVRSSAVDPPAGVSRQLVHLGDAGQGVSGRGESAGLLAWFRALAARMRYVRVACGDWTRVLGESPTVKLGLTGVFLDPPYAQGARDAVYVYEMPEADAVRAWATAHGDDPRMRIALCGYEGEHEMPASWSIEAWTARGGYGGQGSGRGAVNRFRERIWFSPHCLQAEQLTL